MAAHLGFFFVLCFFFCVGDGRLLRPRVEPWFGLPIWQVDDEEVRCCAGRDTKTDTGTGKCNAFVIDVLFCVFFDLVTAEQAHV